MAHDPHRVTLAATVGSRMRSPVIVAIGCQLGAALGLAAAVYLLRLAELPRPPIWLLLAVQGAVAAALGYLAGLAWWWTPLHLALPPAVLLAQAAELPVWIYPVGFALLVLVFWNSASDRVPLYLTNRRTWQAVLDLLPRDRPIDFIDLGSGIGGVELYLAGRRPDSRFTGVESAPMPFAIAWLRWLIGRPANLRFRYGDLWSLDLSEYDVVYCFLSPEPMPRLFEKARSEMRPGSLLISNSFQVPGAPADDVVALDDRRGTQLHIWRM